MASGLRIPVLVGVGAVQQRCEDPAEAAEPLALMQAALERAAEDAGSLALLRRTDWILVPRGFWDYADPGRALAERFGAANARTTVAEIGVLQTTLFARAASAIAEGKADVVLIAGGEAKYRQLRAQILKREAKLTQQLGVTPDEVWRPQREVVSALELESGLGMPVSQYAIVENALRHAEGRTLAAHRQEVAELWSGMSLVAAANPDAWSRDALAPEAIREASPANRMLAFPYTKLHNSQWNVDQAAGLVLCSQGTARSLGVPEHKLVYPHALADANHMLPLSERRELQRSYGFLHAGARALERAGVDIHDVAHLELYSCFPSAVRLQIRELGVPPDRRVTETGGMAFAGGPLNNFVLQALAKLATVLRADPGSIGMLNAVSGILTKQGVSLWSTRPPERGFAFDDVSAETARDADAVTVARGAVGAGRVASYTVLYEGDSPTRVVAFCDLEDGRRAVAGSGDPELAAHATREELCDQAVRVAGDAFTLA